MFFGVNFIRNRKLAKKIAKQLIKKGRLKIVDRVEMEEEEGVTRRYVVIERKYGFLLLPEDVVDEVIKRFEARKKRM